MVEWLERTMVLLSSSFRSMVLWEQTDEFNEVSDDLTVLAFEAVENADVEQESEIEAVLEWSGGAILFALVVCFEGL